MNENMSIEEIETLISENNKKMSILKEKIEQTKKDQKEKFNEVVELISEITNTEKLYYDYITALGSPFFEFTETERGSIEAMMPIYEQKIKVLKEKFKNMDFQTIL